MNLPFTSKPNSNQEYESKVSEMLNAVEEGVVDHLEEVLMKETIYPNQPVLVDSRGKITQLDNSKDFAPPPPKSPAETLEIEREAHKRNTELKKAEIKIREEKIKECEAEISKQKEEIKVLKDGIARNDRWEDGEAKTTPFRSRSIKTTKTDKEISKEGEAT